MKRGVRTVLGALLVCVGAVWVLQGIGRLPGSFMSGDTFWAVAGGFTALVGLGIMASAVWRRSSGR